MMPAQMAPDSIAGKFIGHKRHGEIKRVAPARCTSTAANLLTPTASHAALYGIRGRKRDAGRKSWMLAHMLFGFG